MKILFTGGGSAGHVTPNIALIDYLSTQKHPIEMLYMGSHQGIEKTLVQEKVSRYLSVTVGKWRRYRSWRNALTPFQVALGIVQATWQIGREKPQLIFSKGGFVAFPAVIAGFLWRIPVIAHESDLTPGLANRLSYPFVTQILLAFSETSIPQQYQAKAEHVGTPIRSQLLHGDRAKGLSLCHFQDNIPCLLVMGGSSGSQSLNQIVRASLNKLTASCQVIHLCGNGNLNAHYTTIKGYKQFEYVNKDLPHLIACADVVVSRAGANSIAEWMAMKKPHVLIPLSTASSRGDQLANAKHFSQIGTALVRQESELDESKLTADVKKLIDEPLLFIKKMESYNSQNATELIAKRLINLIKPTL